METGMDGWRVWRRYRERMKRGGGEVQQLLN
jgi:hypothetical protein